MEATTPRAVLPVRYLKRVSKQLVLPMIATDSAIQDAVQELAAGSREQRGAVFTRREVVEFILDLAGYTSNRPLHTFRLLEPSFGEGDFLLPVVDRLLTAYVREQHTDIPPVNALAAAVCAVEVHKESVVHTFAKLRELIVSHGLGTDIADALCERWICHDDFLLHDFSDGGTFDFVIGNPPYVRQESIAPALLREYRDRYQTLFDRADLYVPFFERGLMLLAEQGVLGFICSDRWMKNTYGAPLRALVSGEFHLAYYVDMVDTPAFTTDVMAYPAITIIKRQPAQSTRIAFRPEVSATGLRKLAQKMVEPEFEADALTSESQHVARGSGPWMLHAVDQQALVSHLEAQFGSIEQEACRVGIGIATGADRVYIGDYESLDVEADRKLPLVTTKDIVSGVVKWQGFGVINVFGDDGSLVDLLAFPRLAAYLRSHEEVIRGRAIARRRPDAWFRTIDNIQPGLAKTEKLLIGDIKGHSQMTYEQGRLYPHHNLYYIASDVWDLEVLQAILATGITELFVSAYSTRMRGGYFRYQAQYLRRIRLPQFASLAGATVEAIKRAWRLSDQDTLDALVRDIYALDAQELALLRKLRAPS
jgi:hypothetical protein